MFYFTRYHAYTNTGVSSIFFLQYRIFCGILTEPIWMNVYKHRQNSAKLFLQHSNVFAHSLSSNTYTVTNVRVYTLVISQNVGAYLIACTTMDIQEKTYCGNFSRSVHTTLKLFPGGFPFNLHVGIQNNNQLSTELHVIDFQHQ